ncbi:MAG: putative metal-binding motif-containing protein, partial [Myxococcales bacterium]|nr:putative metal-binding motif-containing protein [Myxococcales bacterium]
MKRALLLSVVALSACADATDVSPMMETPDRGPATPMVDAFVIDMAPVSDLLEFEAPCTGNIQCRSNFCIPFADGMNRCTRLCADPADCPAGMICQFLAEGGGDGARICVPEPDELCEPCGADAECGDEADRCLPIGRGDYCAKDCTEAPCPEGYVCSDIQAMDGGDPLKQCLPESGLCAGCIDPDGDMYGEGADCLGIDCDEQNTEVNAGAFEICNGVDDDCDFRTDEEVLLPEGLCLTQGVCVQAAPICVLGGWDCRYPGTYELSEMACDTLDNDCDGLADEGFDFNVDPQNCGRCQNRCDFPNAVGACVERLCEIGDCVPGWIDLNGRAADGCETRCDFVSDEDIPDLGSVDANCDGLDGDASRAVYVDGLSGIDDADPEAGTRNRPFATISAGLAAASIRGHDVYVSHGVYPEAVTLVEGVHLYGGYDASESWRRDVEVETVIRGGVRGLVAQNIITPTEVQRFRIISAANPAQGGSSYGVFATSAPGLILRDNLIEAGAGGPGVPGRRGDQGQRLPPIPDQVVGKKRHVLP